MLHTDNLLRRSRLEQKLTIDELVQRTKVPRSYVEMIDDGRLAELPAGIYGRSYIRAVAAAVGVDADSALAACATELAVLPDPIPALREIARERTAPNLAALVAERIREWYAAQDHHQPFRVPGTVYLSAGLDAVLLFLLNAFIVGVTANACRVPVERLVQSAGIGVVVVCAFTWMMYFALLAGIGGQTLGMWICGTRLRDVRRPLDLRAIGARAVEAILGESSVLVDWLCASELPKRRRPVTADG